MKYKYFVSYVSDNGYGCTQIETKKKIKNGVDITELGKLIGNGVVILYWRRF